ncbi:MAG: CHRD domain-containing protein [Solirubrobacteraceae bacterium]
MRSKLLVGATAALVVGLAGCASSGSGTGAEALRAAIPASRSPPTQIYRVRLTGAAETPRGPAHGVGAAIIAFHGDLSVCWRFAHLHGFTQAISAHIQVGINGRTGQVVIALSPGPRLHHQGCVPLSPAVSRRIWAQPHGYFVSIRSKQFPEGAVRGQL